MTEKEKEKTILTIVKDGEEQEKEINKPTPEETEQFKQDFEKGLEDFRESKWEVSEKGSFAANDVGLFLMDFMKKFAFWTKTGWMGLIKMEEELKKAMSTVTDDSGLMFDYQMLEFCAYMLSNPGNIGLDTAYEFEKIADKYAKIAAVMGQKVEEARNNLKHIQYLQEKWAAAEQGFFLSELESSVQSTQNENENAGNLGEMKVNLSNDPDDGC